jgi:cytochrome c-type biogenesis protein CcmH/NrfG
MRLTPNTQRSKGQRPSREIAVAAARAAEYNQRVRSCSLLLTALPVLVGALFASTLPGCATFEGAKLYERGTQALDRGDTAGAIADLEHAAQLVPQSSEIQNHLGLAHAAAGHDDAALLAFRHAVELDCSNEAAQQNLTAAEARKARIAARTAESARSEPGAGAP